MRDLPPVYTVDEDERIIPLRPVLLSEANITTIERLSDAAIRAGCYETAVEGYALALRLRTESGFHPLRRAGDDPSVT